MAKWSELVQGTPMDIVNEYYEQKKTPGPLDKQIGGSHYKSMGIQPVEFILSNDLGFCEGNAVKYLCRYKSKGGVEDLEKAKHYIEVLIDKCRQDQQKDK